MRPGASARPAGPPALWGWLGLLALLLVGCSSTGPMVDWEPSDSLAWTGSGDGDALVRAELVRARADLESGDPMRVAGLVPRLREFLAREPSNLAASMMLQDARLAAGEARSVLAAEARALASGDIYGEPFAPLLAARLEPDPAAARLLIEGPLADTGASLAAPGLGRAFRATARFALAHLALAGGDTARARSQLQAALELDPGHFAARRLEAHLLRREGDLPAARAHLARWVEVTAGEPVVASADWYDAALDLAILETSAGRLEAAAEALARLEAPRPGGAGWALVGEATARRGLLLEAVLASDEGRHEQALGLAREARAGLQPASSLYGLSLVQEAELLELYLGRPEQAAYAWGQVLERFGTALDTGGLAAGGDSEFDELLRVLGARVRLARLEAAGIVPAEARP